MVLAAAAVSVAVAGEDEDRRTKTAASGLHPVEQGSGLGLVETRKRMQRRAVGWRLARARAIIDHTARQVSMFSVQMHRGVIAAALVHLSHKKDQ